MIINVFINKYKNLYFIDFIWKLKGMWGVIWEGIFTVAFSDRWPIYDRKIGKSPHSQFTPPTPSTKLIQKTSLFLSLRWNDNDNDENKNKKTEIQVDKNV
jgi:hypothetical protein